MEPCDKTSHLEVVNVDMSDFETDTETMFFLCLYDNRMDLCEIVPQRALPQKEEWFNFGGCEWTL